MLRNNPHITADQRSTLVDEACIATHHGGGTADTDGHARDTKRSDPPAYKDNYCGIFSESREAS